MLPNLWKKMQVAHDPRDLSLRWREEFFKLRNGIDLFRAALGGVGLVHVCIELTGPAVRDMGLAVLVTKALVLVIAVALQTVRIESGRVMLVAPVFFIFGLSFSLIGWMPALFAMIMVWVINRALPTVGMFLFAFAVLQVGFGYVLKHSSLTLVLLSAGLAWMPVLWGTITHRRLERMAKTRTSGRS
ncbi:MAG: hypothetical protein H7Y06_09515 [Opitutaceae bacterium]|nr:hypothetical protein [Opitutaceae bacterium]